MIQHVAFVVFVQNGVSTNSLQKENNELRNSVRENDARAPYRRTPRTARARAHAQKRARARADGALYGRARGIAHGGETKEKEKRGRKEEEEESELGRKIEFSLPFLHIFFD